MMEIKDRLAQLIRETPDVIQRGDFTLVSGIRSSYFIDLEELMKIQEGSELIAEAMAELLGDLETFHGRRYTLLGVKNGGYNVARSMGNRIGRRTVGIDPKINTIDEELNPTLPHALVDDVASAYSSVARCSDLVFSKYGFRPPLVIYVVDTKRGGQLSKQNLQRMQADVYAVLYPEDLGLNTN